MNKLLLLSAVTFVGLAASAQPRSPKSKATRTGVATTVTSAMPSWTEWHDQQVNEVNRYKLHTNFFAYEDEAKAEAGDLTKSANYLSLDGT